MHSALAVTVSCGCFILCNVIYTFLMFRYIPFTNLPIEFAVSFLDNVAVSMCAHVSEMVTLTPSPTLQLHEKHMGLVGSLRAYHLWLSRVGSETGSLNSSTHFSHCEIVSTKCRWLWPSNICCSQISTSKWHVGNVLPQSLFLFHRDVVS